MMFTECLIMFASLPLLFLAASVCRQQQQQLSFRLVVLMIVSWLSITTRVDSFSFVHVHHNSNGNAFQSRRITLVLQARQRQGRQPFSLSLMASSSSSSSSEEGGEASEGGGNEDGAATTTVATSSSGTIMTTEGENFQTFSSLKTPLLAEIIAMQKTEAMTTTMNPNTIDRMVVSVSTNSRNIRSTPTRSMIRLRNGAPHPLGPELVSDSVLSIIAVYGLSGITGNLLSHYEWVQTVRYSWPLFLGGYYCYSYFSWWSSSSVSSSVSLEQKRNPNTNQERRILLTTIGERIKLVCGLGLIMGGLADIVLPVWMTGPNFITHAGLLPDCALVLLCLGIIEHFGVPVFHKNTSKNTTTTNDDNNPDEITTAALSSSALVSPSLSSLLQTTTTTTMALPSLLLRIALWSELYKLGESSLDEILSLF